MTWKKERRALLLMAGVFLAAFFLPVGAIGRALPLPAFLLESLHLVRWYAREHVLLCLVPSFFIAGAIAVFLSQASVMKYLGARANKIVAYGVASVSGTILAVCSCTILPLFAGIYRMGAGIGPATAFLYSGPAINILAIILTARVLGPGLGIARAIGAILFGILIGLFMHLFFRNEEMEKANAQAAMPEPEEGRPLYKNALYFASMIGILVFANWGRPEEAAGIWHAIHSVKWIVTGFFGAALAVILVAWYGIKQWPMVGAAIRVIIAVILFPDRPMIAFTVGIIDITLLTAGKGGEAGAWFDSAWGFAKQILPLLLYGILIAGALLGRPGHEGLIPSSWIASAVGGNSITSNLFASIAGAFMYFATLTEVPILQGLLGAGMGKGPALALLLAGPALSLPNMLVIRSIIGTKKTIVFICLVVVMAALSGMIYGAI